jgi:glycosyltransferase involved in cell wall biosynthesis
MKKVLILAYDFEPLNSIGAQRPLGWFKYFKQFGIHPVIVTRHWDEISESNDLVKPSKKQTVETEETEFGTILRVPFRPNRRDQILLKNGIEKKAFSRKILSLVYSIGQYYWTGLDNRSTILKQARNQLKTSDYAAIIATGEPFILFRYASLLSKQFGVPWIADYRDGWSQNYAALHSANGLQKWLNENVFTKLEKRIVSTASLCTFTVESHQKEVETLLPNLKSEIVMNGYFEELFEALPKVDEAAKPYTIAYSGTIYPYQELELFLEGFQLAIKEKKLDSEDIQLIFYGLEYQPEPLMRVLGFSDFLLPYIQTTERMPLENVIVELNKANALLLLATPSKEQIYAKVFDYLALKKPIILCPNDNGSLEKIVLASPRPMIANTTLEVKETVLDLFQNPIMETSNKQNADTYSRRRQAKKMAMLVDGLKN